MIQGGWRDMMTPRTEWSFCWVTSFPSSDRFFWLLLILQIILLHFCISTSTGAESTEVISGEAVSHSVLSPIFFCQIQIKLKQSNSDQTWAKVLCSSAILARGGAAASCSRPHRQRSCFCQACLSTLFPLIIPTNDKMFYVILLEIFGRKTCAKLC